MIKFPGFKKIGLLSGYGLLGILLIVSCKKDDEEPEPVKYYYNYYPLQTGHYRVYSVDSAVYLGFVENGETETKPEKSSWELKEVTGNTYLDNTGEVAYAIERYWRKNEAEPWVLKQVYSAKRTKKEAQRVEENYRYLKMIFPVQDLREWDANKYNVEDSAKFKISTFKEVHQPWEGNDSTVLVVLDNYEDLVNKFYNVERYAAGVGLVYMKNDSLNTQINYSGTKEIKRINGYSIEARLKESGTR